jgi:crossover junction endodeoxyribonuclease RuvC
VIYLGVDPGKSGALALLEHDGTVRDVFTMPLLKSTARDEYDLVYIRERLLIWRTEMLFVAVEKQQPMPSRVRRKDGSEVQLGGAIGNYNRGVCAGWAWMLAGLKIPYHLVAPRTWQAKMHEGTSGTDTKGRSIQAAQRLFPGVELRRSSRAKKDHDGKAEALLIAEYGRRTRAGTVDNHAAPRLSEAHG